MKNLMRRIWAFITAGALLAGALVVGVAVPASAHTSAVTGVAECQADGTYTVTWTYNATNVPEGVEAETKAMTTTPGTLAPIDGVLKGGQVFLSVWTEHKINVPGAPVKVGNWSAMFKTVGIPGDFKGDATTMVQTDWKNGPSEDPVGKVKIPGTCTEDTPKKVVVCKYVGTPGVDERLQTGQNPIEVSVNALKDFPGTFPWAFADAHGRSIALGYAPGNYTLADCPLPEKPTQPEPLSGTDVVPGTAVCVEPGNGTATITTTSTSWTQAYVWNPSENSWVLGDKVYAEPVVTTETVDSEDCIPEQPEPAVGTEQRTNNAVCVEPLNGTATLTTDERAWSQPYVWTDGAWVLGEKVFTDWYEVDSETVNVGDCIPAQPEPLSDTEERTNTYCVEPFDGDLVVETETRTWTQDHTWNPVAGTWDLNEKVYTDWTLTGTATDESAECAPVVYPPVKPPVTETPTPVKPQAGPPVLPRTGGDSGLLVGGTVAGLLALAVGAGLLARRRKA